MLKRSDLSSVSGDAKKEGQLRMMTFLRSPMMGGVMTIKSNSRIHVNTIGN